MCGILAVIGRVEPELALKQSGLISHRGPDEKGFFISPSGSILCHERLSIMDPEHGIQPIIGERCQLIHNGEIYNHESLKKLILKKYPSWKWKTHSDSESIVKGYEAYGLDIIHQLDGVFAFVLLDGEKVVAARDAIGVKPLFYGKDSSGNLWFCSEMKGLLTVCESIEEFPPGYYYTSEEGFVRWFKPSWWDGEKVPCGSPKELRSSLEKAVKKRLMSDVPLGALLSGGLDSSLVASIAARELKKEGKKLHTYSVGIDGDGSDLSKAKEVAEFIGSIHHEIHYTFEEGLALLEELIYKLESYDVTSIRASTPMYIMSQAIVRDGVKVVLSGEGADEVFGGYLYFSHAPCKDEFHGECVRRVKRLHTSDVQRADRSTMGVGLEARVPFLDKEFLEVSLSLDPEFKTITDTRREKFVLRTAFDDRENPYLPPGVLWRQKEQFSDGVGYSWVDKLKAFAEKMVSDEDFSKRDERFSHNTPFTKEAYLYRLIFEKYFSHKDAQKQIKKWIPRWQEYNIDPSGRANKVHENTVEKEKLEVSAVAK